MNTGDIHESVTMTSLEGTSMNIKHVTEDISMNVYVYRGHTAKKPLEYSDACWPRENKN